MPPFSFVAWLSTQNLMECYVYPLLCSGKFCQLGAQDPLDFFIIHSTHPLWQGASCSVGNSTFTLSIGINGLPRWEASACPVQETWIQSLHWEDPLDEGMATHSSTLAWRISRTEEPVGYRQLGGKRVGYNLVTNSNKLELIGIKW